MPEREHMYSDLAWTWAVISPKEDYVDEAETFYHLLSEQAKIEVKEVLHLGCGGGHIDYSLKQRVRLTGVDLSPEMLALASALNPEVEYRVGDMRSVRLGRQFDGVFVADSIDYMLTEADLRRAFETAFAHLRPGGVFCTYSESTPERFEQNATFGSSHKGEDLEIALIENTYDPDPQDTTYELTYVYLIRRQGQLTVVTDRHEAGIFPPATWNKILEETGFAVQTGEFGEERVPLFICNKPL
jgi:SAM-dependent methyltransferase